ELDLRHRRDRLRAGRDAAGRGPGDARHGGRLRWLRRLLLLRADAVTSSVGWAGRAVALAAVAVGAGCSGGTPAPGPASGGLQGTFRVSFNEASAVSMTPAFAYVAGKIYDGPVPQVLQLVPDKQEGGCKLY